MTNKLTNDEAIKVLLKYAHLANDPLTEGENPYKRIVQIRSFIGSILQTLKNQADDSR